eukprot:6367215-Amphidinium_carterae.1
MVFGSKRSRVLPQSCCSRTRGRLQHHCPDNTIGVDFGLSPLRRIHTRVESPTPHSCNLSDFSLGVLVCVQA